MLDAFGTEVLETFPEQGMLRLGNALEARAVELTPIKTGELESSSTVRVFETGNRIKVEVKFNAPHAAAAHELPEHSRGERTRRKPGNNFGPAGGKYLERPLKGFQKLMGADLAKGLAAIWSAVPAGSSSRRRRRRR